MENNLNGPKTSPGVTRRGFISGAIAATSVTALLARQSSYGQNAPQVRYPDPNVITSQTGFVSALTTKSFTSPKPVLRTIRLRRLASWRSR